MKVKLPPLDPLLIVQPCVAVVPQGMDMKMVSLDTDPFGAAPILMVLVVVSEVLQLVSTRVTVCVPEVVNECTGFTSVLVVPSPKSQNELPPFDDVLTN